MRLFGMDISRAKAAPATLQSVDSRGWWQVIFDRYAGGWQQHVEYSQETVLAYHAVYSCVTLIANDIGKLRPKLVEKGP